MSKLAKALTAAAGNAAGESLYVEDVFSTYLYEGTEPTDQTIINNIDLDGEGGLVWIANRSDGGNFVFDTERGAGVALFTHNTSANQTYNPASQDLMSFNSDGFTVGDEWSTSVNRNGEKQVSWTFRKAEKFFDVVTYTGDGNNNRQVAHSLGVTPACVIVKNTSRSATNWAVWHKDSGAGFYAARLNTADTFSMSAFGPTDPFTDSYFTVKNEYETNVSGDTYVAYLFASDAGGFGDDGSENIIKCGSYTGNGSTDGPTVTLGFEPQWLMIRGTSGGDWQILDNMRGIHSGGTNDARLLANSSASEYNSAEAVQLQATGFKIDGTTGGAFNGSGNTYIYIAIRRPMKTPESGTEVFAVDNGNGTSGFNSGFPVDMGWRFSDITTAAGFQFAARLNEKKNLFPYATNAESNAGGFTFDSNTGWGTSIGINATDYSWMFKRATGFFDVVAYTGDGVAGRTVAHNLGVAPELMIVKSRSNTDNWAVYDSFNTATHFMNLELSDQSYNNSSRWNGVEPTSEVFTVGTHDTNLSGYTYIAYLFATLAGVSKVGSYTGTGSNVDVDCGFSAGARFILIKRTDSTGDWYVWDSVRGIVAGNDPYLLLNSTAAEVTSTDYIDPLSSGFTVTSTAPAALNASGGSYIFLAIS